jgi:hypothetical protein
MRVPRIPVRPRRRAIPKKAASPGRISEAANQDANDEKNELNAVTVSSPVLAKQAVSKPRRRSKPRPKGQALVSRMRGSLRRIIVAAKRIDRDLQRRGAL